MLGQKMQACARATSFQIGTGAMRSLPKVEEVLLGAQRRRSGSACRTRTVGEHFDAYGARTAGPMRRLYSVTAYAGELEPVEESFLADQELMFEAKVAMKATQVVSYCVPEPAHETWRIE